MLGKDCVLRAYCGIRSSSIVCDSRSPHFTKFSVCQPDDDDDRPANISAPTQNNGECISAFFRAVSNPLPSNSLLSGDDDDGDDGDVGGRARRIRTVGPPTTSGE
jgi:hypothetical protein